MVIQHTVLWYNLSACTASHILLSSLACSYSTVSSDKIVHQCPNFASHSLVLVLAILPPYESHDISHGWSIIKWMWVWVWLWL
jgi:hypothetical protein